MNIRAINESEVRLIKDLAHRIWPNTFRDILSSDQMAYMLDWMYSEKTLIQQLNEGHTFYLIEDNGTPLGFMGMELFEDQRVKIHKLYVLPETQGLGYGRELLKFAQSWAKEKNAHTIYLNVNRFNKAVHFYEHMGMSITKEEDIDIGKGFLMEDYVMELKLT